MRPVINLQHVFHARYECGVGIRRDDPLLFQVRFKDVFFSVRPIVLSLARATMFSSTTLSSRRRNVHFARPLGGSEQASAVSLASAAPSKMRRLARPAIASGSAPPRPLLRSVADELARQSRGRCLAPQRSGCRSILPLPPPASAFNKIRALVNFRAGCLPLWIRVTPDALGSSALSFTTYFFTAISFTVTNRLRRYVRQPSIRTSYALSMTWPTSNPLERLDSRPETPLKRSHVILNLETCA